MEYAFLETDMYIFQLQCHIMSGRNMTKIYHIFSFMSMWYLSCDTFYILQCVFQRHTRRRIKSTKTGMVFSICGKKNSQCFAMWFDFYRTWCVFSSPLPMLRDRKHTRNLIKIVSHHKPWKILSAFKIFVASNRLFIKLNTNCILENT
jgi:hypothetical protein